MSNTDRDTHFNSFAFELIKEMLAQRQGDWIDFNADDTEAIEEYSTIIAQRAYDLVVHALKEMNPTPYTYFDTPEEIIKNGVPDMLVLPDMPDHTNRKQILAEIARISQEAGEYD